MKTRKLATVLAAAALTLAMSVASAMAFDFTISGYTSSLDVLATDGSYGSGLVAGPTDTFIGGTGQYLLSFTGGTGNSNYATGLSGSMTLFGDAGSSVLSYDSGAFLDSFYISTTNGVFTLGSVENGNMLSFGLGALPLDPNYPTVGSAPALPNSTGTYAYINQVFLDSNGNPFAYDQLGTLMDVSPVAYGSINADGFLAATAAGTFVDLVVDDANVPVPEPGTFLLFGGGLAGLAFWRRRKA